MFPSFRQMLRFLNRFSLNHCSPRTQLQQFSKRHIQIRLFKFGSATLPTISTVIQRHTKPKLKIFNNAVLEQPYSRAFEKTFEFN